MKALVLIDLQNEFLDAEKGRYVIPDSSKIPLLENIRRLLPAFRSHECIKGMVWEGESQAQSDNLVIWVRAEYSGPNETSPALDAASSSSDRGHQDGDGDEDDNLPIRPVTATRSAHENSHFLTGTHAGKTPCCPPGSEAAQFYPAITPLIDTDRDLILTKTWFSAFKETGLAEILRSRAINEVYFAGLLSNVCVLASVTDSIRLGATHWKTHVVVDCLGYLREKSHVAALAKLSAITFTLTTPNEPDAAAPAVPAPLITSTHFHPHPTFYYVNGSIPSWRVQIALHHKQLRTNDVRMYVMRTPKPTRSPAFLAINPRGKAPVFVDTDPARTRTCESLAILLYLEEYYPGTALATSAGCYNNDNPSPSPSAPPLLPPRDHRQKRARVLCLMQESENLHSAYDALEDAYWADKKTEQADGPSSPSLATRPIVPSASAKFRRLHNQPASSTHPSHPRRTGALGDAISPPAHAAGTRFLAGTHTLSLADCALYPILAYMVHRGFVFTERFEGLERYYGDMTRLECVQRARPEGWGDGRGRGKTDVFGGR
ncbi:hypothetical protein BDBG_05163 [Blastomyces gilchristii SLH14081]|uniref:GST N-terminal domain-containing protein n=1 Tax=Blastomyces gilchristii (strain SLH14081) TaxID=559298 RepID=A0A179UNE8_BLAGS|nr:uncharacterized protein BDBG_05163 [Blastomyces gilchristii SLH14081]OAT09370.1 hypothetical protein BDBG_05163 [Blastomyces gilchristii SLH14081]